MSEEMQSEINSLKKIEQDFKKKFYKHERSYQLKNLISLILSTLVIVTAIVGLFIPFMSNNNLVRFYCEKEFSKNIASLEKENIEFEIDDEEIFSYFDARQEMFDLLMSVSPSKLSEDEKEMLIGDPFSEDDESFWKNIETVLQSKELIEHNLSFMQREELVNIYKMKDKTLSIFTIMANNSLLRNNLANILIFLVLVVSALFCVPSFVISLAMLLNRTNRYKMFKYHYNNFEKLKKSEKNSRILFVVELFFFGGFYFLIHEVLVEYLFTSLTGTIKLVIAIDIILSVVRIVIIKICKMLIDKKIRQDKLGANAITNE